MSIKNVKDYFKDSEIGSDRYLVVLSMIQMISWRKTLKLTKDTKMVFNTGLLEEGSIKNCKYITSYKEPYRPPQVGMWRLSDLTLKYFGRSCRESVKKTKK